MVDMLVHVYVRRHASLVYRGRETKKARCKRIGSLCQYVQYLV